jgi:hypothetical protein
MSPNTNGKMFAFVLFFSHNNIGSRSTEVVIAIAVK